MTDGDPSIRFRIGSAVALGLGGAGVVAGFLLRDPAALLFAVPLLLAPLAALEARPAGPVEVATEGTVAPLRDPNAELRLRVRGPGATPGFLEADLVLPPPLRRLTVDPGRWSAGAGGPVLLGFPLTSDWPTVTRIDPPDVRWRDPMGLVALPARVVGEPTPFERPPAGSRHLASMIVQRLSRPAGAVRAPLPAAQGEFRSVRPFEPGDGVRQINWRATARRAALVSNSFLQEVPPDLVLALDVGPWELPDDDASVLLGVTRAAAHVLAGEMNRRMGRFAAAVLDPFPRTTPLSRGRHHLGAVQELLAGARPGRERPPVERYARALQRAYPPRSAVLLFGPFVDATMLTLGYHLRRWGFQPFVLGASPLTLTRARVAARDPASVLGLRLLRLSRQRELGEAWQWGPTTDWEELGSLAPLAALFRRPLGRGGAGRG